MQRISAVIITRNEERDIARALDAVAFADEIVVVDSGSTDRTVEICAGRGARVLFHPFRGYGPQKRFAVAQATHDWVLCVDADEVVDGELAGQIRALRAAGRPPPFAAFALTFRTVFMGTPLRHGPRERHVRLFDRRRAGWTDAAVHETVAVDGPVGALPGIVLHESARDIADALEKLNEYTSRAAAGLQRAPPRSLVSLVVAGAWHFFRHGVLRRYFLNGVPGFTLALLYALGSVVKHLKVLERDPDPQAAQAALRTGRAETGGSLPG